MRSPLRSRAWTSGPTSPSKTSSHSRASAAATPTPLRRRPGRTPPAGVKSFALMVHEPDAMTGGAGSWHWVMLDIPPASNAIAQCAGTNDGACCPRAASGSASATSRPAGTVTLPAEVQACSPLQLHAIHPRRRKARSATRRIGLARGLPDQPQVHRQGDVEHHLWAFSDSYRSR